MLFLCVLPVSYAIVWLEPSLHCGPFSGNKRMYYLFTDTLKRIMPTRVHKALDYIASPAAIIPLLLLLVLFIYYLISLTGALRVANQDLKTQLHKERTEERKKMMKLMEDKIMDSVNVSNKLSNRWKKVLEVSKPSMPSITAALSAEECSDRKKILLAKAMKNILRKKYSNDEDPLPKITTDLAQP
jgi:transmembrane channel-like protein